LESTIMQTQTTVPVPGTDGLLAVRRHRFWFRYPSENWALVHVPTDKAAGLFRTAKDARDVALQLYAAAPDAWALRDEYAVVPALPAGVAAWVGYLMRSQRQSPCPPVVSLMPLSQFLAEREAKGAGKP
jgi:hypothetical protein